MLLLMPQSTLLTIQLLITQPLLFTDQLPTTQPCSLPPSPCCSQTSSLPPSPCSLPPSTCCSQTSSLPPSTCSLPPSPVVHKPSPYHAAETYADTPAVYQYGYAVADDYAGTNFAANENRDGYSTNGEYRVALPDGRTQIVSYNVADAYSGYVADVRYEGEPHYDSYKPAHKPAPYHPAPAPYHPAPYHA
ncbi:uncharacterized protein [Lepeophtheirus salmonis]|uniref:uncharacterized protein n=1 Tax=Lepeophtheirus salmonis TaxID=72036 RepID=UPI001AE7DC25|nr:cuticle protein 19.8-like [Lepeophtheirus salmonis]